MFSKDLDNKLASYLVVVFVVVFIVCVVEVTADVVTVGDGFVVALDKVELKSKVYCKKVKMKLCCV